MINQGGGGGLRDLGDECVSFAALFHLPYRVSAREANPGQHRARTQHFVGMQPKVIGA